MKTFVSKLIVVLFFTFITLAACELMLRVLGFKYSGSTYTADQKLGWALRPGATAWEVDEGFAWSRINSHGYRDRERSLDKPQGTIRIAVIGDSLTEARQVPLEKTFTYLAEDELNRNHCTAERPVEVLNFGIPGYGTGQELILLRERVWRFKPDMIVLQVYSGNDIFNNHRGLNISSADKSPYFLLRNGRLELDDSFRNGISFNPVYMRIKGLCADLTNKFVLLQLVYKVRRISSQSREIDHLDQDSVPLPSQGDLPGDYPRYLAFLPPSIPAMTEAWQVTERLIAEFNKEVMAHNVPLLLMIVPTSHQILPNQEKRDEFCAKYGIESLEYADDRIESLARSIGIPVLRVTRQLFEQATRTGYYMSGFANSDPPGFGHINERGHKVVARELVKSICETLGPR